jgi:hypothetical protein
LTIVLSDLLFVDHCLSFCPFSFDHCIISKGQIIQWSKEKGQKDNNDLQTEGQIIQWSEEKGQKDKQ